MPHDPNPVTPVNISPIPQVAPAPNPRALVHQDEHSIAKSRRIFVNRNLKMKSVNGIGFDMDHTLAIYNKVPIESLAFDETKKKLVHDFGYPEAVLSLKYDPEFCIRGLVVDKVRGNLVKMDRHKYAVQAYHGKRVLGREDRKAIYANKKLTVYDRDYRSIDTLFSVPEGDLFAQVIDMKEVSGVRLERSFEEIFDDIRNSIDAVHRDDTMKSKILANPDRYFLKDPNLALCLDKFLRGGKRLFIVTNSGWEYTMKVMSYLLDGELDEYRDWREYFDLVVVDAQKPGFFTEGQGLEEVGPWEGDRSGENGESKVFRGGNAAQAEAYLGIKCDQILFVGDHTFGDILRSKKSSFWRTVMVVEELERELSSHEEVKQVYEELEGIHNMANEHRLQANALVERIGLLRETKTQDHSSLEDEEFRSYDDECSRIFENVMRLENQISELMVRAKVLENKCQEAYNPFWGQLFKAGRENSRFGDQVEDFACLYTVRVSNFLYYPSNKYFQTARRVMPHEL